MQNEILKLIEESQKAIESLNTLTNHLESIANVIISAYKNHKKVVLMGNGGSAADAQHLAAELVSKFKMERKGLPALALNTNTSVLTAIGNDYDFKRIFARQIEAHVQEGDVVVGLSTSGNSPNIVEALISAKELGAVTIGFTGQKESLMSNYCDHILKVGSGNTPRIQEAHITAGHIICELVEKNLFEGNNEA